MIDRFAHRLLLSRERLGLTQEEVGKRSHLVGQTISHFECGRREPSLRNLRNLCLALDVSANYLLGLPERLERGVKADG